MGAFFILCENIIQGIIVKIISKDYYVLLEDDSVKRCSLRGKFKKELQFKKNKLVTLDAAVIGDNVIVRESSEDTGVIVEIEERKNYLSRKAVKSKGALKRGERLEQIIAANLDNLFIVASIEQPKFNNRFLDRVIVAAESCQINTNIIINKVDLDADNMIEKWEQLYSSIGYNVFVTSATENLGVDTVKNELSDCVNIFWGQSGVGKSTMLNKMYPELDLRVGEISEYSNKGIHTTVSAEIHKVEDNTFIIDTPGIREIDPYGIKKEDLGHYFIDFIPHIQDCKFNTCTHYHEPGCEILNALKNGKISEKRYSSYLSILESIEDDMYF